MKLHAAPFAVSLFLAIVPCASAQTKPTKAELDAWEKDPNAKVLEASPCKKITWLVESEQHQSPGLTHQPIGYALGWWGRGFIEGAVYMIGGEKAEKKASEFGLSVDVVQAHLKGYCYTHPTETPFDAIQDLTAQSSEVGVCGSLAFVW